MASQTTSTHKIKLSVNRARLLADRIEVGAASLAAFAEGLSEAEWLEPVSSTDRRPVGVILPRGRVPLRSRDSVALTERSLRVVAPQFA